MFERELLENRIVKNDKKNSLSLSLQNNNYDDDFFFVIFSKTTNILVMTKDLLRKLEKKMSLQSLQISLFQRKYAIIQRKINDCNDHFFSYSFLS